MAETASQHNGADIPTTMATSFRSPPPSQTTSLMTSTDFYRSNNGLQFEIGQDERSGSAGWSTGGRPSEWWQQKEAAYSAQGLNSTGKGILIGMMSAFGSAALIALIVSIVYFFRHTNRGRIFLDRMTRPGEFDDEQQFIKEEEEALEGMDDLQKAEYHRAKGGSQHKYTSAS